MCVGIHNFSPEQVCLTKSFLSTIYIYVYMCIYIYIYKKNPKPKTTVQPGKIRNKNHAGHHNKHLFVFLKKSNNFTKFFRKKKKGLQHINILLKLTPERTLILSFKQSWYKIGDGKTAAYRDVHWSVWNTGTFYQHHGYH